MGYSPLPLAHCLGRNAQTGCEFLLGHLPILSRLADDCTDVLFHITVSFLLISSFSYILKHKNTFVKQQSVEEKGNRFIPSKTPVVRQITQ